MAVRPLQEAMKKWKPKTTVAQWKRMVRERKAARDKRYHRTMDAISGVMRELIEQTGKASS